MNDIGFQTRESLRIYKEQNMSANVISLANLKDALQKASVVNLKDALQKASVVNRLAIDIDGKRRVIV
jgi:hypothetical protein